MTVVSSIPPWSFISVWFLHFEAPFLGVQTYIIIVSSWLTLWLLSLVISTALKYTLFAIRMVIPAFFNKCSCGINILLLQNNYHLWTLTLTSNSAPYHCVDQKHHHKPEVSWGMAWLSLTNYSFTSSLMSFNNIL